jgi:hypothetical protein
MMTLRIWSPVALSGGQNPDSPSKGDTEYSVAITPRQNPLIAVDGASGSQNLSIVFPVICGAAFGADVPRIKTANTKSICIGHPPKIRCYTLGVKERESDIQASILDYLAARRHFAIRLNNIPAFNRNADGTITMRRLPKHALPGLADILVVHTGHPYFLEVKRKGTYQSPEQKEFERRAIEAGAFYAVVRSIDDVRMAGL